MYAHPLISFVRPGPPAARGAQQYEATCLQRAPPVTYYSHL